MLEVCFYRVRFVTGSLGSGAEGLEVEGVSKVDSDFWFPAVKKTGNEIRGVRMKILAMTATNGHDLLPTGNNGGGFIFHALPCQIR